MTMSISRKMVLHLWPRNTMRSAYLQWQVQENRLVEARQRLDRQYLALRQQAQQVQTEVHQGILRAARSTLDQPPNPMARKLKDQLARVFALRGKGLFRRVPSLLKVELSHYIDSIAKICRSHDKLEARLRLAQAVIRLFTRNPEFCSHHFFRLALISPESAWLVFHIRKNRLQGYQANQYYLSKKCKLQEMRQPSPA
jgi:hypothetical protein